MTQIIQEPRCRKYYVYLLYIKRSKNNMLSSQQFKGIRLLHFQCFQNMRHFNWITMHHPRQWDLERDFYYVAFYILLHMTWFPIYTSSCETFKDLNSTCFISWQNHGSINWEARGRFVQESVIQFCGGPRYITPSVLKPPDVRQSWLNQPKTEFSSNSLSL